MGIYFSLIALGIVQGATEFLPVSSSGHLAVLGRYFALGDASFIIAVALHVATLLAVLVYFRRKIIPVFLSWRGISLVAAATAPTAIIGFALKKTVEGMFSSDIRLVLAALAITGFTLFAVSYRLKFFPSTNPSLPRQSPKEKLPIWENITITRAILIGIAQGIAVIPGISRSGATVSSAIFLGVPPEEAAEFSFIASIPAVAGAGILLDLKEVLLLEKFSFNLPVGAVLLSLAAAFVVGIAAIKIFVAVLGAPRGSSLRFFSYYLWAVSAAGLMLLSLPL